MAFTRSNLRKLLFGIDGNTFWYYNTPDSSADVETAGYFNNTQDLLKERDPIWVNSSDGKFIATIESVNSREAQTSISVGGFFAGLGSFPTSAFSWDAENAETPPSSISFTRASTAMVLGTTDGTTNWYQTAKSGEIRYEGLRRVENPLSNTNYESLATWAGFTGGSGSNPTIASSIETPPPGSTGTIVQALTLKPGAGTSGDLSGIFATVSGLPLTSNRTFSVYLKVASGTKDIFIDTSSGVTQRKQITLTTTWQRFSTTQNISGSIFPSIEVTGDLNGASDFEVLVAVDGDAGPQVEIAQTLISAPNAVVDPATTYNANVAGVRYFATTNGNSVDGSGVVTEAAGSAITGGGYLAESAATNLIRNSDDLTTIWVNDGGRLTITDNGIGELGLKEFELSAGTATGVHRIFQELGDPQSGDSTFTVRAKNIDGQYLTLRNTSSDGSFATFDLANGTVTNVGTINSPSGTIVDLGDGWYECSLHANSTITTYFVVMMLSDIENPSNANYSYTAANESILIALPQAVAQDFPSSPIVTSGSTVTRNKDDLETTGPTAAPYTFFADATWPGIMGQVGTVNASNLWSTTGGTPSDRLTAYDSGSNVTVHHFTTTGISSTLVRARSLVEGQREKIAARYAINDAAFVITGQTPVTDGTVGTIPVGPTKIGIGDVSANFGHRGRIHKFVSYDVGLTDDQLETLVE